MRQGIVSGSRTAWYDRSLANPVIYSYITTPPHGVTNRQTYDVPAGYNMRVGCISLQAIRATAATAVGVASARVLIYDAGATNALSRIDATLNTNTVGDSASIVRPADFILLPTSRVIIQTQDGSTGGTVTYQLSVLGNLFTT